MKKTLDREYLIAEGLDDYFFGSQALTEAQRQIAWGRLFRWYDDNWHEIALVVGVPAVDKLDLEQLWACYHHPEKFAALPL